MSVDDMLVELHSIKSQFYPSHLSTLESLESNRYEVLFCIQRICLLGFFTCHCWKFQREALYSCNNNCPSWRLSIIAISQVEYLAIIDNLAGRPHNIICHVSIALVFQYRWLLLDTLLILRDDGEMTLDIILGTNHFGLWQKTCPSCGDVPIDFALLCHNGPYLGDDMHMCGLRRLHSTTLTHNTTHIYDF